MSSRPELHPLGMAVHSLPQPGPVAASLQAAQRTRWGRWKMLLVLLVCAAPVVASYFTYYVVRPEGRRNFGELVQQQPMPEALMVRTLDGQHVPLTQWQGQWLLVSVGSAGACDAACEERLYLQRQLREGLGRDKDRVDWVWLVTDGQPPAARLQSGLQQAVVLQAPQAQLATWLQPAQGQALEAHIYVVDPQGHWMLRWPADLDRSNAAQAKRDLERLMRASASWDQAGR